MMASAYEKKIKKNHTNNKSVSGHVASSVATAVWDDVTGKDEELTWKETFYNGLALFAVGVAAAAMVVEGSVLVNAVSIACAFLGPSAAMKQNQIADMDSLRKTQNMLREQVNVLTAQNKIFGEENDRLEASSKKLRESEVALGEITKLQGQGLDTFVQQVNEYKKIQQDIKKNLEASIIQNLLSVIVHSDKDNDFQIDPNEVPTLVLKLQNLNGVTFNEANFRKAMKSSGYSLRAVLEITKNLLDDKIPEKDNIFVVKTERLLPKSLKKEQNLVNE